MADLSRDISPGESVEYRHPDGQGAYNTEVLLPVPGDTATLTFPGAPPPEPDPPPPPAAISFRLIEPISDAEMQVLAEGDTVMKPFAIKIEPAFPVGSLRVFVNTLAPRNENSPPYAVFTNSGTDFAPATVPVGALTVKVEAWSKAGGAGVKLNETTLHLTVEDVVQQPPPPDPPPPPPPIVPPGQYPTTVTSVISAGVLSFLDLPTGWVEKACDFFDRPIPQGQWGLPGGTFAFPPMTRGGRWRGTNPSYRDSSGRGRYAGPDTCEVKDGELIEFIRSGVKGVVPFVHNASGERMVSRPVPLWGGDATSPTLDSLSRRRAVRIDLLAKFPGSEANGYKVAYLLWGHARINQMGYAEEDFPEFRFGSNNRVNAYHHKRDTVGGQVPYILTPVDPTAWHLYTMIYWAKGFKNHATGYAEFYFDGVLGGRRSTDSVSDQDLFYAKQTETWLKNEPVLPPPSQGKIRTRLFRVSEPV